LAAHLDQTQADGWEWVPTLIFYTAIHLTEALLAEKGIHPEGHAARANAVGDEWDESAQDLFEELRDLSQQWRYSARPPTPADVRAAKDWAHQLLSNRTGLAGKGLPRDRLAECGWPRT
jgi:uncharacterized protein (UPF0332 family)